MTELYHDNGVKARADGYHDVWQDHRTKLIQAYYMNDIDLMAAVHPLALWLETENKLYIQYVCDDVKNKGKLIRDMGVVAVFDRKASERAQRTDSENVELSFHLCLCRLIRTAQGIAPKFFHVIGNRYPMELQEFDLDTGLVVARTFLDEDKWMQTWQKIGLVKLHQAIYARIRNQ